MEEIKNDAELNKSLKKGHDDFITGRGSIVKEIQNIRNG